MKLRLLTVDGFIVIQVELVDNYGPHWKDIITLTTSNALDLGIALQHCVEHKHEARVLPIHKSYIVKVSNY